MEKPKILLLTHGGWGLHLVKSLEMILGKLDFVEEVALMPQDTFPDYMALVKEKLKLCSPGSVIITDLFGGTTTNVAAKLGNELGFPVVSGLNAPLLLEAASEIARGGAVSIARLLLAGNGGCRDVLGDLARHREKTGSEE